MEPLIHESPWWMERVCQRAQAFECARVSVCLRVCERTRFKRTNQSHVECEISFRQLSLRSWPLIFPWPADIRHIFLAAKTIFDSLSFPSPLFSLVFFCSLLFVCSLSTDFDALIWLVSPMERNRAYAKCHFTTTHNMVYGRFRSWTLFPPAFQPIHILKTIN